MKLGEPVTIRDMEIRNRVVMPAMAILAHWLGLDGSTEATIDFYGRRANGGVGAVIVGSLPPSAFIPEEDLKQTVAPHLVMGALERLAARMHESGTRIGVQLWHTNMCPSGTARSPFPQEWVAPSPRVEQHSPYQPVGEKMRQLTVDEIHAIIGRFALASSRIKESGVDFVEFHQAHGHLPYQFFSPIENQREDRYGGGAAGRMRFGLECINEMRKAVGEDYPIFVRLGAVDEAPGGVVPADAVDYAVELEKASVDCLDVSVGSCSKTDYASYVSPRKKTPMGTYASLAETIKKKVSIPVVAVGRINTPEIAEEILGRGQADLVAIGRQLICDPSWMNKVIENRADEIVSCTSCNTFCWFRASRGKPATHCCIKTKSPDEEWQRFFPHQ
ncbi:NADH:flavin oxidoreductase [Chloroflexota bacterium]